MIGNQRFKHKARVQFLQPRIHWAQLLKYQAIKELQQNNVMKDYSLSI